MPNTIGDALKQPVGAGEFNKGNALDQPPLSFPLTELPDYECQVTSPSISPGASQMPDFAITMADALEVADVTRTVMLRQWPEEYAEKWMLGDDVSPIFKAASVADSYDLARLVHMDKPMDLYQIVLSWVLSEAGAGAHVDQLDHNPFLEHTIKDNALVASALELSLQHAFDEKWIHGQARPEEVLGYNVSLYPAGCPTHPSTPAGHGAAGGTVEAIFTLLWDLSPELMDDIRLAVRQFIHARTFAGVHFGIDNELGRQIGFEVTQNFLGIVTETPVPMTGSKGRPTSLG